MQHCGPSRETSPEPDSIRTYPELMRLTRPFTAVPVVRALMALLGVVLLAGCAPSPGRRTRPVRCRCPARVRRRRGRTRLRQRRPRHRPARRPTSRWAIRWQQSRRRVPVPRAWGAPAEPPCRGSRKVSTRRQRRTAAGASATPLHCRSRGHPRRSAALPRALTSTSGISGTGTGPLVPVSRRSGTVATRPCHDRALPPPAHPLTAQPSSCRRRCRAGS